VNQAPLDPRPRTNQSVSASDESEKASEPETAESPAFLGLPKIVKFDALARCGDEIWIENDGQIYRLRKTRQGKLILTK